jgi:hypothetical protein
MFDRSFLDPKPKDSLEDILYEATPSTIADYAIGVGSERWQQDQPSFYRYREDAFKDAVSRLRSALKEGL